MELQCDATRYLETFDKWQRPDVLIHLLGTKHEFP